jgi:pimeloyl-ACP methyl ester carboxylesterase
MANDVFGLMDVLGVETAHLAGISMGGMIVQQAAIQQPERVRSLISIMSSTGEPGLPGPTPQAAAALSSPPPGERSAYIEHSLKNQLVIGSPGFALDEDAYREMAGRVFDRAFDPDGIARQMAAVAATGSRKEALAALTLPALVIHGDSDPLIPLAGGEATANAIPGAKLCVVPGMGHNVPEGAWPTICDAIAQHTRSAED